MNPLQLQRYEDILVVRESAPADGSTLGSPIGFHAERFELAQISEEAAESMQSISLLENAAPRFLRESHSAEAALELTTWLNEPKMEFAAAKRPADGIRSITLNVTQICNLHCTYCAAGGDGTFGDPQKRVSVQKTLPQLHFLLGKLAPGENFHIVFLGGEPLLYPQGIDLICEDVNRLAEEKGITIGFKVVTNGTVMNSQILDMLEKYKISVIVSCDGPPEVQDLQRPSRSKHSSSAMVEQTLALFATRPKINVGVHAVMNAKNPNVYRSYAYFKKFAFSSYAFTFAVEENSAEAQAIYLQELFQIAQNAYQDGGLNELRKIENFDAFIQMLEKQEGIENHCGIGKDYVMIDARNDVYPCPWMVGMKNEKMGSGVSFEFAQKYAGNLIELHECQTCWARKLCGGGCHFIHKFGSDNGIKNTAFCERTRAVAMMSIYFYGNDQIQ